ncbi:MAG: hypothetical protein HUU02_05120 [Bacteroidetes bacterium]|nr:hypothetical protein [Bacteroidota bacterium]
MERLLRCLALICCTVTLTLAGPKPIDYVVNNGGSRMTIALNGPVQWTESLSGTTLTVTVTAPARHFIVKKMNYSFRDGVIRTFAMAPVHPDTERIRITLRRDQAYELSYDASAKRFVIRFFNGAMPLPNTAAAVAARPDTRKKQHDAPVTAAPRAAAKKQTAAPSSAPIDIATLAVQQVQEPAPSKESVAEPADAVNTSAVLLLVASTIIILAGGGAVAYVLMTRRFGRRQPRTTTAPAPVNTEFVAPAAVPVIPAVRDEKQEEEQEFAMAVEYAEQYLRSQGEFELQQRLEQLNSSSMQKRLEMAAVRQSSRKGNNAAAAEKLGISVGELDLASRLQKFHAQQMTESV